MGNIIVAFLLWVFRVKSCPLTVFIVLGEKGSASVCPMFTITISCELLFNLYELSLFVQSKCTIQADFVYFSATPFVFELQLLIF